MNKILTMMIGLPRSGKSTEVEKFKVSEVIISADQLRPLVYGQRFFAEAEPLVWAIRGVMLKAVLGQGVDIIVDETNTTAKGRAQIIELAKKYGYIVEAVWVDTPISTCMERANASEQDDLVPIIAKMAQQFEAPQIAEGFESIVRITPWNTVYTTSKQPLNHIKVTRELR